MNTFINREFHDIKRQEEREFSAEALQLECVMI
jgi:hypothetical protein